MIREEVDEEDIAETVAKWTGVPVTRLLEGETQKLLQMETRLAQRVVGQDEALRAVANAVRRARSGLSDPNRPIGSFLFLGPTGVGKTELARALAEFLFDDERAMIRLDMSEYMEKHTVARLVGAPPGYVGYEEGGQLTEAVRRRPYSVVLFDEIEKAHADVFNVLLQILDDGRLTDGQGRTVDFRNTVVIMTSNLGSHIFREYEQPEKVRPLVMQELRNTLRPEFLNRIDEIVIFRPLGREELSRIVDIQLAHLKRRLGDKRIALEVTDRAKALLAREGYDPTFGARPLKRTIQRLVQDPLALKLLEHEFNEGDTVTVDAEGDSMKFSARAPESWVRSPSSQPHDPSPRAAPGVGRAGCAHAGHAGRLRYPRGLRRLHQAHRDANSAGAGVPSPVPPRSRCSCWARWGPSWAGWLTSGALAG